MFAHLISQDDTEDLYELKQISATVFDNVHLFWHVTEHCIVLKLDFIMS